MLNEKETDAAEERLFSWRRIRISLVGILVAMVIGLIAVNLYTYFQYGGTMLDPYLEKEPQKSPAAGKLAFDKGTKFYIGVIRGEGHTPRNGDVYFIEQAGGNVIDVSKRNVEVREPGAIDK